MKIKKLINNNDAANLKPSDITQIVGDDSINNGGPLTAVVEANEDKMIYLVANENNKIYCFRFEKEKIQLSAAGKIIAYAEWYRKIVYDETMPEYGEKRKALEDAGLW